MSLKGQPELFLLTEDLQAKVRQGKLTQEEADARIEHYITRSSEIVRKGVSGELTGSDVNHRIKLTANESAGHEMLWSSEKMDQAKKKRKRKLCNLLLVALVLCLAAACFLLGRLS
jgi:hypothetical protein